jgi:1-acyl-sn-glycerol-3-phosphate acyltransferase
VEPGSYGCAVFVRLVCHLWCFLYRWRVIKITEPVPTPCVVIAGPHTSNWDFFGMVATARINRVDMRWLGKREMFDGPLGWFFRALGGVSVDRDAPGGLIGEMAALLTSSTDLVVVVPAEGTRDRVEYWKSGFYRIALEAHVPIQFTYVDRATRTSGFGPWIMPSGDVGADMDKVRAFYADKVGIKPEKFAVPRLREEADPRWSSEGGHEPES